MSALSAKSQIAKQEIIARHSVLVKVLSNLKFFFLNQLREGKVNCLRFLDKVLLLEKERRREGLVASWFPGLNNSRTARTGRFPSKIFTGKR